jgi:hypothetical protein
MMSVRMFVVSTLSELMSADYNNIPSPGKAGTGTFSQLMWGAPHPYKKSTPGEVLFLQL